MVFITNQSTQAEILRQQRLAREIATEQVKISSGNKLLAPSDNPQDWVQISEIGRQQSMNAAWKSNVAYAQSRAAQASSSLEDVNNLMANVNELLVQATAHGAGSAGAEAIALSIEGIRASINEILNKTDYQGTPIFDSGTTVNVPVSRGLSVEAVGTRESIAENVIGTKSLDQILTDAINAVRAGVPADRTASIGEAKQALDHVIVAQSKQAIRAERLDQVEDRIINNNVELVERRSGLEDTDVTEAAMTLQSKLTTLEAAQAAFARVAQKSLFDYLS